MSITAVIVVFAVCWFLVLLIVLPLRMQTQAEAGSIVPGTPAGAPAGPVGRKKLIVTTIAATLAWAAICLTVMSGAISIRDFDVMGRLPPISAEN
ncbi:DUF1467 family protein [Falsigemmobacter intermedius]|uniref:DUF1467 family protein n=1 Tax=Falsigemmobacter intermedius TaxID=1553448 RepID=A0A3S3V0Q2_9RHOB|nr:DUF1467 family protein [Falsigemmobacter intermedius]RWY43483.1 DUF1467 family protein [Falsigemmobacter intermedius]